MQDKIQQLMHKQEVVQSAISYGGGASVVGFMSLADVASVAQSMGIILGCLVIAVRLIHDFIALKRFIRTKPRKE